MDEQLAERGERRPAQQLELVEDERRALGGAGERVGEPQRDVLDVRVEVVERDVGPAQRVADVRPQAARVRVAGPEREPGGAVVGGPAAEQDGLAPAGRRAHEGERAAPVGVERRDEARARDRRGRQRGDGRPDGQGAGHVP